MSRYQPALLGGILIGVLSSLPGVSIGNLCCCLWVIAGGLLTVFLQQRNTPLALETGEAVIGGLIAGLVGAVITTLASWAMMAVTGPLVQNSIERVLEQNPNVPPEVHDFVARMTTTAAGGSLALIQFCINVPIFAIFGVLGSLLGLALFRKKTPPAAMPPATPPATV